MSVNMKHKHLGYYDHIEDAARAYEVAAQRRFGDFAYTGQETTALGEGG